jgi:negative regulator of flagellin synthesis FlgM
MKVTQPTAGNVQASEAQKSKAAAAAATKKTDKASDAKGAVSADAVKPEISARAKEMKVAKEIAENTPDVRQSKVDELKAKIAAGKYNVDAEALASKLVDEHLKTAAM